LEKLVLKRFVSFYIKKYYEILLYK